MKKLITIVLASLVLLSCTATDHRRSATNSHREGEIYVVPTWTKGSLEKFLVWADAESGPGKENRTEFQRKLKEKICKGFGTKFPRAVLPILNEKLVFGIALSGSEISREKYIKFLQGDSTDRSDESLEALLLPDGMRNPDLSDEDLRRLVGGELNKLAKSLNDAVQAKNKNLTTSYPPNSKLLLRGLIRGVRYIVEQGVTYCVYGSYALEKTTAADGTDAWGHWKVSHEGVTAWLDVYMIVTEL